MMVRQEYGKHKIEVSGTEDQVEKMLAKWSEEIKDTEPYMKMCAFIRDTAIKRELDGAKDLPIIELLKTL